MESDYGTFVPERFLYIMLIRYMRIVPESQKPFSLLTDMSIFWRQRKAEISPCAVLARKRCLNYSGAIRMALLPSCLRTAHMAAMMIIPHAHTNGRYIVCLSGRRRMSDAGVSFQ